MRAGALTTPALLADAGLLGATCPTKPREAQAEPAPALSKPKRSEPPHARASRRYPLVRRSRSQHANRHPQAVAAGASA